MKFLCLLFINLLLFSSLKADKRNNPQKMNIVFFLVDDLGWRDIGVNGSEFYETPRIDQFAKEGVRFTDAYATCHVCSPSRASILTGKYPARLNLTDWLPGRKNFPFQKLKNNEINQNLPFEENTLAEYLRDNGYTTAIYGKWHLGEEESSPLKHGFQERMTEWNKGWPLSYFPPYRLPGFKDGENGEYLTDRVTKEAIGYIERNKEHPFFLYLSHFAVHDPIQGRPDLVEKYRKKLLNMKYGAKAQKPFILETSQDQENPLSRQQLDELLKDDRYKGYGNLPDRTVKIKQLQDNIQFAAMVESMDESFGKVIDKLKELGIYNNTIVVFVSDNGGMSAMNMGNPNRKILKKDVMKNFSTSNLPLRGAKGWLYEGGLRVPMIMNWPNHIKKGFVSDIPVIGTDFYPTLLEMVGLPAQPAQHADGVSLVPLLTSNKQQGKMLKDRALYWHFPHYSNHSLESPGGAIRYGDYKLIEYFENNTIQLFNLKKDIEEQRDLSKQDPKKAEQLRKMLHEWRKSLSLKDMQLNVAYTGEKN